MAKPEKKTKAFRPLSKRVQPIIADAEVIKSVDYKKGMTREQGEKYVAACQKILKLEDQIQKKGYEFLLLRFKQACELKPFIGKGSESYGEGIIKDISKDTVMSVSFLYQLHGWAERCNFQEESMRQWYADRVSQGANATLKYFLKEANEDHRALQDPAKRERKKESLIGDIEKGADAVQQLTEIAPGDEASVGAMMMYAEELSDTGQAILQNYGRTGLQYEDRWERRAWLDIIKSMECPFTGVQADDPNHLVFKSRGNQASDLDAIPMSREIHDAFHACGSPEAFEKKYNVDLGKILAETIQKGIDILLSGKLPF